MTQHCTTLVTGATGFIGSAVLRAAEPRTRVRAVARSVMPRPSPTRELVAADLLTPAGIAEAVEGVSSVIHCASYVGSDASMAWRVNYEATCALVGASTSRAVDSFVYVSTASVYAPGVKRGADESHPISPTSEVSHSRRAAEEAVLRAGGTVIRPHLLYGVGDRWVIPLLVKVASTSGLPGEGRARVSLLDVDALAHQIWGIGASVADHSGRAYNSVNGAPVALSQVIAALPRTLLAAANADTAPRLSAHQLEMLAVDNWFTSALDEEPGPIFHLTPHARRWYEQSLNPLRPSDDGPKKG